MNRPYWYDAIWTVAPFSAPLIALGGLTARWMRRAGWSTPAAAAAFLAIWILSLAVCFGVLVLWARLGPAGSAGDGDETRSDDPNP